MSKPHDWREVTPEHSYTKVTGEIVKYPGTPYMVCADCGKRLDRETPPLGRCRGKRAVV